MCSYLTLVHGCCMFVCALPLQAASRSLAVMCDAVWPPNSGKDVWLRGSLAKWLLQAGFEGNNGEVLRQVRTHAQVALEGRFNPSWGDSPSSSA